MLITSFFLPSPFLYNKLFKYYLIHVACFLFSAAASGSRSSQLVKLCSRFNLSDDDIKKEVSDDHILQIYPQLEKWKRVAAHLGLTRADIGAIESEARPDEELMRLYMLQKWKEKKTLDGTASYQVLLEALISCTCSKSAVQVCEMLSVHIS